MVQGVRHLLFKHEDLSLDAPMQKDQTCHEHACNMCVSGGWRQEDLLGFLAASLALCSVRNI